MKSSLEQFIRQALLQSHKFYEHLDGSIVCKTCEKTLEEGCTDAEMTITLECGPHASMKVTKQYHT